MLTKIFATIVLVCTVFASAIGIWALIYRASIGGPFSWQLALLTIFWIWGVWSSGRYLFGKRDDDDGSH